MAMGKKTALLSTLIIMSGCATITPEAIKLNQSVSVNIRDAHKKHRDLVSELFAHQLSRMEDWFVTRYLPVYQEGYIRAWNLKQDAPFDPENNAHRAKLIKDGIGRYEALKKSVEGRRDAMLKQLDDAYGQLAQSNDAVAELAASKEAVAKEKQDAWNQAAGQLIPPIGWQQISAEINAELEKAIKEMPASGNG